MGIQIGKVSLSTADRIDFFKTLSGWLNSGGGRMSVSEAINNTCDAFSHEDYIALKPKMDRIRREVQAGQSPLYQSLQLSGLDFARQEIAIIEAAEKSSQLRQSVPALVAAMEMQSKGKRELTAKLMGPLVIGVLLIIMTLGVMVFMLPMVIGPVLERNPDALKKFPLILQGFWAVSVWVRTDPYIPTVFVGALIVLFFLRKTPLLGPHYQRFLLWWGVSRRLILGFNGMLIVYFMPALVRSGLPTYRVCQNLSEAVNNPILSGILRTAAQDHENGMRLSRALERLPLRTSFVNAVAAGEATGSIADRVQELQEPYVIELERQIKKVVGVLKFLVMGLLLPLFIVSTYTALVGPIFALLEY